MDHGRWPWLWPDLGKDSPLITQKHKNTSWRVCKESHSFLSSNLTFPFTIVPGQKQKRSGGEVCVHSSQPRYLSHMKIHELESLKRSGHPATPHRWPWVRTAEASENPHCIRINNCREMKISSNITMILSMDHDPWTLDHGPWCMTKLEESPENFIFHNRPQPLHQKVDPSDTYG